MIGGFRFRGTRQDDSWVPFQIAARRTTSHPVEDIHATAVRSTIRREVRRMNRVAGEAAMSWLWRMIAFCGLVAIPLAACSTTATPTPSQTVAATRVVSVAGGLRVIFSDAPPVGSTLTVTSAAPPPSPPGWLSLAKPVHLTLNGGSVASGATLEFEVPNAQLQSNAPIGIATYDEKLGRWTPVTATLDSTGHIVETFTRHFSWWEPWTWDWASIAASINQDVGQLVGKRASPATCSGGSPSWVSMLAGISNDPAISIRDCAQSQGSVLDVEIVNNRPYGQVLTYGAGVKWGWHDRGQSLTDMGLNALMDSLMRPNELYLPPLSHASVGIWELPNAGSANFHIGPTAATLLGDVLATAGGPVLRAAGSHLGIPLIAACGTALAAARPLSNLGSPSAVLNAIVNVVPCAQKALLQMVSSGLLDSTSAEQLAATLGALKSAGLVGDLVVAYGIEWDLLDLWVDHWISGSMTLGGGFSVLAQNNMSTGGGEPPSTTPPSTSPPPPTNPPPTPTSAPPTPTPAPPTLPIYTVMNTSETPPDGVWFRWDPHTADTNRITGDGVYMNEQVQLQCYAWGDAVGPYNDTLWYRVLNVTRPTIDGMTDQGYLSAHYIDDGAWANQVDSGVPAC